LRIITRSYKGYDDLVNEHWRVEAPALLISENVIMFLEVDAVVYECFAEPISHDAELVEVSYDDDRNHRSSFEIELPRNFVLNHGLLNLAEMSIAELGLLLFKN
jgi:hypothetical protein